MSKKLILKCLLSLTILCLTLGSYTNAVNASRNFPTVYVNDEKLEIRAVVTHSGTTLVPFRAIFERFGMNVVWDNEKKSATATNKDTTIVLTHNSYTAYVNDIPYELTQAPSSSADGHLGVNLRFIAEALGYNVKWVKTETDATIHISN